MAQHKSRAFVLDAADYRETSKLLHLFCENEGRISLIAKGIRGPKSKNATAAEPFSLAQVTYRLKEGETLGLLTGIEQERTFQGVRGQLESYALASYWFEILNVATQARMASPEFFGLTESFLNALGAMSGLSGEVLWHFGRLLQALGFGADFAACNACGTTELLEHFDTALGAAVCSRCAQPRRRYLPIARGTHAPFVTYFGEDSPGPLAASPTRPHALAFLALLNELLVLHLDRQFRSFPFVRTVLEGQGSGVSVERSVK